MRILNILSAALVAGFFAPAVAWAVEPCNRVVVDSSDEGILSNVVGIEEAARRLQAEGAVVRVRVTQTFSPYGRTLESAANAVCDSWGGPGGVVPANYIILWASVSERALGVYRGDIWADELPVSFTDSLVERGRGSMSLAFAGGQFDNAFIIGINDIVDQINAPPPQPRVEQPVQIIERVEVREPAAPREPFNWAPVGYGLLWLIALIAIIFLGRYGLLTWGMRAQAEAARRKSYGAFTRLNETHDRLLDDFGEGENLKQNPSWTSAFRWALWRARFEEIATEAAGDNDHFRSAEAESMKLWGTYREFRTIRDELNAVHKRLEASHDQLATLECEIAGEEALAGRLVGDLDASDLVLAACKKRIIAIRDQDFIVAQPLADHAAAAEIMKEARKCFENKQHELAESKRAEAEEFAEEAAQKAEALPVTKAKLLALVKSCRTMSTAQLERVPAAKATFQEMLKIYADSSLEDVVGNGTEAENRLAEVPKMLEAVSKLLGDQKWEQAEAALDGIGRILGEAESLIDSIGELEAFLKQSDVNAVEEVDEAANSVEQAKRYLGEHPHHDNANRRAMLTEALQLIFRVRRKLAKDRPDFPAAFTAAAKADDLADTVYDGARDDEAEIQRKRRLAEKKRQEVVAKITKARRFRRNHSSDINRSTEAAIDQLYGSLDSIGDGIDTLSMLTLIEQMDEQIDAFHGEAKSQFRAAEYAREQARERAREAREAADAAKAAQDDDDDIFGSGMIGSTGSWGSSGGGVTGSTGGW